MSFVEALTAHLLAPGAVAALAGDRIQWTRRPQGFAGGALRLTRVGASRDAHLKGFAAGRSETVQVDSYGATHAAAEALADAVVASFGAGRVAVDGVTMILTDAVGPRDLGEDGSDGFEHRLTTDLVIWHNG